MKEHLMDEAIKIVNLAQKQNIILRVIGALAIRIHCPNLVPLHKKMDRQLTDIDLIGYRKQERDIVSFFEKQGYSEFRSMSPGLFLSRKLFYTKEGDHIDVFFDKLEMCHEINFAGRLETSSPAIPLPELALEKLQIVKINEKDIKDLIILFLAYDVEGNDSKSIDANRITQILSKEWGFYYTVTTNLKKIKEFSSKYTVFTKDQLNLVTERIDKLLNVIENTPKSMGWKIRAKVGPKRKWYKDVEEVERGDWLEESPNS